MRQLSGLLLAVAIIFTNLGKWKFQVYCDFSDIHELALEVGSIPTRTLPDPALAWYGCNESVAETTHIITTQAGADILANVYCVHPEEAAYFGNVVISPSARGTINITTPLPFRGDLLAEKNSLLERLIVVDGSGPYLGFRDVTLRNLSALTTFQYRGIQSDNLTTGTSLINLPVLNSLVSDHLWQSRELNFINLPPLAGIPGPPDFYSTRTISYMTIHNVGLHSLDELPSCISGKEELSIDGVPNVKNVTIYSMARLNFTGSDSVSMVINYTGCSYSTNPFCPQPYFNLGNVRVSRLSSFSRDPHDWRVEGVYTDKFHAANNTFRDLELEFDELSSLYIENNTNLEPILLATT